MSSRGIPRLINILSHKAMLAAYGRGNKTLTAEHVRLAVRDTEDAQMSKRSYRWVVRLSATAATVLTGVVALYIGVGS